MVHWSTAPSLLRASVLSNEQLNVSSLLQYNEIFITGGYVFGNEDDNVRWKPSCLIKIASDAPIEYDFNLNVWFNNIFSLEVSTEREILLLDYWNYRQTLNLGLDILTIIQYLK